MSYNVHDTLKNVQSKLQASGYFKGGVLIGEPKAPPEVRFTAAIMLDFIDPAEVTLGTLCASYGLQTRIYDDMLHEPQEDVEIELAQVVDKFMDDLAGEFDLGGNIRNVEVDKLRARWGYITVRGTTNQMYRIADVFLVLRVNDVATLAA